MRYSGMRKHLSRLGALRLKGLRDERGQSMVEFAVSVPVLVIFLYAIWFISDLYVAKYQTLMAARYATWRLARMDDAWPGMLVGAVRAHYFDDDDRSNIEIVPAGEIDSGPMASILTDVFAGQLRPTTFAMRTSYTVAPQLGGLDISEENPDGFTIDYTHFVGGNSWLGCRTSIHEMYGLYYSYVRQVGSLF